jgi:hypothetical protein
MNYDEIKQLARETEQRVTDLIALAPQNDPFYTGTPGDWALAEWFAGLWRVFNYQTKVHIRRVHYQIISQDPPVLLPNGKPYENTEECWNVLNLASKAARYLRLVDPGAFNDRRNPDPVVYASYRSHAPEVYVSGRLYASDVQLPDFPDLPGYQISGYHAQQPYHLEVWCFPPETLVQTINGPLPMSALQVGDLVLTHKGRYRPVTRTFVRQYTGELVRVRTRYSARDVRMTPNHQVLILQGKTSHGGRTARQLAWVAARDLVAANTAGHYKGDYLAFPRGESTADDRAYKRRRRAARWPRGSVTAGDRGASHRYGCCLAAGLFRRRRIRGPTQYPVHAACAGAGLRCKTDPDWEPLWHSSNDEPVWQYCQGALQCPPPGVVVPRAVRRPKRRAVTYRFAQQADSFLADYGSPGHHCGVPAWLLGR